ncbi:HEPN domain-containing protein [Cylindrospermum stagnale PCC 7417]|uniref:HEPN domain-containing protein n=1 Tax=Cylindrospermum stagnale PCC 7417 TaxID=56107 RepID=K9X8M4_9NOST|nr:HEPN domain-containing protein [Cylindrospermum stagnale]AFZ28007.1 HEPN domain-containing protein [Cylindrospermum stagnale PCC 7417]
MLDNNLKTKIEKLDLELRIKNLSLNERKSKVIEEICPNLEESADKFWNFSGKSGNNYFNNLELVNQVEKWYEINYPNQIKCSLKKIKPFYIQGDIYFFDYSKETELFINCIINLSKKDRDFLVENYLEEVEREFRQGKKNIESIFCLQKIIYLRNIKNLEEKNAYERLSMINLDKSEYLDPRVIEWVNFAIEDLSVAINILESTRNYQIIVFPICQAIEKFFKACLIDKEKQQNPAISTEQIEIIIKRYSHKITSIKDNLIQCNYFDNPNLVREELEQLKTIIEIDNSPSYRYPIKEISSADAVKIIDITLNIFSIIKEKLLIPPLKFIFNE